MKYSRNLANVKTGGIFVDQIWLYSLIDKQHYLMNSDFMKWNEMYIIYSFVIFIFFVLVDSKIVKKYCTYHNYALIKW